MTSIGGPEAERANECDGAGARLFRVLKCRTNCFNTRSLFFDHGFSSLLPSEMAVPHRYYIGAAIVNTFPFLVPLRYNSARGTNHIRTPKRKSCISRSGEAHPQVKVS